MGRDRLPTLWIGWLNAIAGGMMLGAAYLLMEAEGAAAPLAAGLGSGLGIAFIYWVHAAMGTGELALYDLRHGAPEYGYQLFLVGVLHSASEGIAIGVAMAVDLSFGIFLAAAIALHNIPEGAILAAVLRARGLRLGPAAALAVAANISQILLAVTTFGVVAAAPASRPWVLGFAAGAHVNLVLAELLPESYREAGQTSIAVVAVTALGMLVLFRGLAG